MINRAHRFHGHNSLRFVYQHGIVQRSPLITIKYIKNSKRSVYRLAVVVSKKVSKSAVLRNRIRRRIFEQVRLHQSSITSPFDIVITVFNEQIANMPAPELNKLIKSQLTQAKILSSNSTPVRGNMDKEGDK